MMKKIKKAILLLALLLTTSMSLSAQQEYAYFDLNVPVNAIVENSLYNQIEFQDSRSDYEYERVKIDESDFVRQLDTILKMSTDKSSRNGTLFFLLRSLDFETVNDQETAIYLHINLYEKKNADYYFISTLDTTCYTQSAKQYNAIVSKLISDFTVRNLTQSYTDNEPYSSDNIKNIVFFEKDNIKLYNITEYTEGIYTNYRDFADQTPSINDPITAKFKKSELKEVKIPDAVNTNKLKKIQPKDVYAVVVDGKPYIATDKKFLPLYKDNDEFYFEDSESNSRLSFAPSFSVGMASGGYRGGGIGIGVFSQTKKEKLIFRINHLNGNPNRLFNK